MKKDLEKNYNSTVLDTPTSSIKGNSIDPALFEDQKDAEGPFRGSIVVKSRSQNTPQSVLTENQQAFLKALNGEFS